MMDARTLFTTLLGALFSITITAAVPGQLDVDFTATPATGAVPLAVAFTDTTTGGTPTFWSWDFGDGSTSSEQHPTHTYTCTGSYTVSLLAIVVFPIFGTETKVNFITVDPAPGLLVVDFTASPRSP